MWDEVRGDQKACDDTSSGESLDRIDDGRVVFIDRREGGEARVAYRDEKDNSKAVDCGERSGKQCECKGSGVQVRRIHGLDDGVF